jgi:hypothetical protein
MQRRHLVRTTCSVEVRAQLDKEPDDPDVPGMAPPGGEHEGRATLFIAAIQVPRAPLVKVPRRVADGLDQRLQP